VLTVRQEDSAITRARTRRNRGINARCSYCGEQLKPTCNYTRISVIDDTGGTTATPTYRYIRYTLCNQCGKAIWSADTVRLRSKADAAIKRVRESILFRDAGFVRPMRSTRAR
jgi:hypothetical protein